MPGGLGTITAVGAIVTGSAVSGRGEPGPSVACRLWQL